jgi:ABC-2 type transport system ATP-binding protein
MIEVRDLTRRYGSLVAVDGVSFQARPGHVVGLLGPNGAGKTTIMKVLTGYHFPDEGSVSINGFDVVADPAGAKRELGYLPENAPLYDELTVNEYLQFVSGARDLAGQSGRQALTRVVDLCDLQSVLLRPISELSKGFRQRVGLAQALIHDPDVVILDEPTTGLDPNQIQEVRRVIRELGREKTVLLSTHILREVEALCEEVLILDRGRIAARGTTTEIAHELRSRTVIEVTVVGTPSADQRLTLERLGELIAERPEEGCTVLRISLNDGIAGEDVFDWATAGSLRIRSLVPERYSLEQIFTQLTTGAG